MHDRYEIATETTPILDEERRFIARFFFGFFLAIIGGTNYGD